MIPRRLRAVLDAPPRSHSPAPIWWWSGERLDRRRLRDQLERFAAGGVYNLVILNLAPSGPMFGADADEPAFFTGAWWELLDGVCEDALELGVSLWFYDQLGFSGADLQARLVRDVPAYAGQWLERDGGVSARGFDYLSAQACAALLDRVHGEYERRLGHRFGSAIVGSFQDELPSIPTWTEGFAEEFAARRGYDLAPYLPSLWKDGNDAALRVRRDFHLTRGELAEEAFFRPLAEWHERHGLLHGCDQQDPARAGHPVDGVRLYADYARTHRWFGAPGSDHHGDARVHSSLAHLYGRDRVWIEAFHSSGWGGTLEETFDWLLPWLRAGATLYNPHAAYYTTKAGWWEWAPPSTDWRQPYWPHHRVFAEAVTRLCAALSMGRHLCDVAVLFPTATAQAGSRLDGADSFAAEAQETYRALVGDLAWFQMVPGALGRLGIDADVIDDDSVQRAEVTERRLAVAGESYGTVLLPACTVLEGDTARRLAALVEAGGRVVAIGPPPRLGVGDPAAGEAVARLASLVDTVADTGSLAPFLEGARRVEAPVPALVREVDGATVVFVTAAESMASRVSVGAPDERGIDLGWLDVTYDFDPGRYHRDMRVRVSGVSGPAFLVSPFGGEPRPLPAVQGPSWVDVVVPFDDAPAALLIFPGDGDAAPQAPSERLDCATDLGSTWDMELVPTLDNTWGDFARPYGEMPVLESWRLWHRAGDDPSGEEWTPVHATFGPHAVWTDADTDGGAGEWRPIVYSDARGIRKDPIHRAVLGPKGHIPEEFLDFGQVRAGRQVVVRTRMTVPSPGGHLVLGAAAAKTVLLDGETVPLDDRGYLATSECPLPEGSYMLEVRLVPDEDLRLRGHLSTTTAPTRCLRPEWMTAAGTPRPGAQVAFTAELPASGVLQVASAAACRVLVDGVEFGRQGGFEPYAEQDTPRVGRYTLPGGPGARLTLVLTEDRTPASVLVDGPLVSGTGWQATREGAAVPVVARRAQYGDPAALHLHRRPHPLPAAGWLEDLEEDGVLPAAFAVPGTGPRTEWLRCTVPPGATRMRFTARAEVTCIVLDGATLQPVRTGDTFDLELPGEHRPARTVDVRLRTNPGHQEGAALAGPVRFETGPGTIDLGDWEDRGLTGYSGGVRYRRVLDLATAPGPAGLDLGHVRGTAEVTVNGTPAGVRICAPYTFDLGTALRQGRNEIDIVVYGTLAPYLDDTSPTHFVFTGQRASGLMGPVTLQTTDKPVLAPAETRSRRAPTDSNFHTARSSA
ncbi:hypothetical protein GCM10010191_87850 [Actinomadura vinacea]|uniref:Glycoside hydrolase n=1 Tax=Actinomadura vinacea TaxID=115336 RepID=A0ABN3KBR4_9ACTN